MFFEESIDLLLEFVRLRFERLFPNLPITGDVAVVNVVVVVGCWGDEPMEPPACWEINVSEYDFDGACGDGDSV